MIEERDGSDLTAVRLLSSGELLLKNLAFIRQFPVQRKPIS
jgi:hypothetical protein